MICPDPVLDLGEEHMIGTLKNSNCNKNHAGQLRSVEWNFCASTNLSWFPTETQFWRPAHTENNLVNLGQYLIPFNITLHFVFCFFSARIWLVVWNIFLFFHSVGNFIIPTDELIFFRGVGRSTTNQELCFLFCWSESQLQLPRYFHANSEDIGTAFHFVKHMRDQFKALRVATTTTESPAENVGHLGKPGGKSIFLGIKGRIAGREESPPKIITAIENQEIPPSKSRILVPSWKSWILIVLELDSNTFWDIHIFWSIFSASRRSIPWISPRNFSIAALIGVIPMGFRVGQCDLHRIPGLWSSAGDRAYRGGPLLLLGCWAEAIPIISQHLINQSYM